MKPIYMDNNATTQVAPEVVDEMMPYFSQFYGNPSSMHTFGGNVGMKIKEARAKLADLLGAHPEEIVYTSCGTESDSTAIYAALRANPDKRHIVTSKVEHPAIKNLGLDFLYDHLTDETAIVSLMWANNETGVIFPVEEIAEKVHHRGIVFHSDAVQFVGKRPINMAENKIDTLSLSGHKLHAPKGIGALYVRKGTKYAPFMMGGHQEHGRRGGTENVAAIIGMGKAAELAAEKMEEENQRVSQLRDKLENALLESIPNSMVNGDTENRLPNTSSIAFEYVEGEAILLMMDEFNICASSGSACTSGSLEPSHVLRAMGVPFTAAHGSIRFSLSVYNTEEEVDLIIEKLPPIIERLRKMSPFWSQSAGACKISG